MNSLAGAMPALTAGCVLPVGGPFYSFIGVA